jgi:hypothetical protein
METIIQYLNILVLSVIVVIVLGSRYFLPSYLGKKGENLATKEDVESITRKIEEVKIQFASQHHALVRKRETYEKIINGLRIFIEGHSATEQGRNSMLEAYSTAWLWASDDVLKKINNHLALQVAWSLNPNSIKQEDLKKSYTDCILEIRKDSGYSNTNLEGHDFQFVRF